MVGEQEKQMKAVVIRQRRGSDLPDKRDCRHVPKFVQAPDMQKLFLITGFISFLPPSPSSTSANVSKSERSPNQSQVFGEDPARLFRSRSGARKHNCPLGPAATLSGSFLGTVQTSHPHHGTNGPKEETFE